MTLLSDSGHTTALLLAWLMFFLAQTVRLTAISIVVLQLLFTLHPWLLESSAFESTWRVIVAVVLPTISFVTHLAIGYSGGYVPPVLYALLRGQDIPLVSTPVLVSISLVMISSASAHVFIRMRDPTGNGPNYIFRLDVFALVSFQNMIINLLAPSYIPLNVTSLTLEFVIIISVAHTGVRNYALNRPLVRPLVAFYRTRLARRVFQREMNLPYHVNV